MDVQQVDVYSNLRFSSFEGDEHPPRPPAPLRESMQSFLALTSYDRLNLTTPLPELLLVLDEGRGLPVSRDCVTAVDRASYSERPDAR